MTAGQRLAAQQAAKAARKAAQKVRDAELVELASSTSCCGFGGTFCVKYPDISNKMVSNKTADIAATGADLLLAGDRVAEPVGTLDAQHVRAAFAELQWNSRLALPWFGFERALVD